MKRFTTVWGILPVFVKKSYDDWGHAKAMIVYMPEGYDENTAMWWHELFHVKQFYAWFGTLVTLCVALFFVGMVMFPVYAIYALSASLVLYGVGVLAYNHHYFSSRREIAAYGESLRYLSTKHSDAHVQANLVHYSKVMDSDAYREDFTYEELYNRIKTAYTKGNLF